MKLLGSQAQWVYTMMSMLSGGRKGSGLRKTNTVWELCLCVRTVWCVWYGNKLWLFHASTVANASSRWLCSCVCCAVLSLVGTREELKVKRTQLPPHQPHPKVQAWLLCQTIILSPLMLQIQTGQWCLSVSIEASLWRLQRYIRLYCMYACVHMCEHVPLSTSTYSTGIDVRTRHWVICCCTKHLQASKALNNPLPLIKSLGLLSWE